MQKEIDYSRQDQKYSDNFYKSQKFNFFSFVEISENIYLQDLTDL
jgi:hypothetical protein